MSILGDKLRDLAVEVDIALGSPSPQPSPQPAPTPVPPPIPTDPNSDAAIRLLGASLGYSATRIIHAQIPGNGEGFTKYQSPDYGGFFPNDAMVVRFVAPPADLAFQVTFVQMGGANGSAKARQMALSEKPLVFSGPDAIWADIAPNCGLTLATVASPYTRYVLIPGKEYFLNINCKGVDGSVGKQERYEISVAVSNNRP